MQLAQPEKNSSFYPLVDAQHAPRVEIMQPYTPHWLWGDKSGLWQELRAAGAYRRAIKNTVVIVKESERSDVEVSVRPRRRVFFHPVRFLDRKDAKGQNEIIVDLGNTPKTAQGLDFGESQEAMKGLNATVHDKLEDQVYYLSHILHHRKLHNELAFPVTWSAIGVGLNMLVVQRFFPDLHTSLTLWFLDSLHKGFSLPGLIETLPGLAIGFASGYGVSRLRNIPHVHHYNREEKKFTAEHQRDQLLQISLKPSVPPVS